MSVLINPYSADGPWLRGNIHTHTTASDGQSDPQTVVDWYALRDYQFLAITDHNLVLPLDTLDPRGMLLVQGEELTHPKSHVVGLGLPQTLPRGESLQEQIDLITGDAGLAIVAHPHWMGLAVGQIEPLHGHLAIELSNQVCYRLNGSGDSVAWWDTLLTRGHRCWGVAVDDTHDLAADAGSGWLMVQAADRSWPAIRDALVGGSFVASTGPRFESIQVEGRMVSVHTSDCTQIRFIGRGPTLLHTVHAPEFRPTREARFELPEGESFVRVEITDTLQRRAWTQPFWEAPAAN